MVCGVEWMSGLYGWVDEWFVGLGKCVVCGVGWMSGLWC